VIESVIVAHGLWMPGAETRLLRNRLQKAGLRPALFQFPTLRGTLAQNVERLARFAVDVEGDRLHFVGYSLGGVVAVTMLAGHVEPRLGRVVCLGSPLAGSRTASRLQRTPLGRQIVGRSLGEHLLRGGIARWNGGADLGIIAGTRSLGIGRLVGGFGEPNDGTVMVSETKLPGATAHLCLPVTHTQMLFDRSVAEQTIHFLRHGSFAASASS
jgi:pimeloyl-ACP methyl ester carboxylesterase